MKVNLVQKANPMNKEADARFFASPVNYGTKSTDDLAKEMCEYSAVSEGDMLSVLRNLYKLAPKYLLDGYSVKFGDLGTLRVGLKSSPGAESAKKFNTNLIKAHFIFTPSTKMKRALEDISYSVVSSTDNSSSDDETSEDA